MTQLAQKQALPAIKRELEKAEIKEQLQRCWKENAQGFMISILDIVSNDRYLQECNPRDIIRECLKAATLKLPIQRELGFAYVVAYKKRPTFILGYKGLVQLAFRTGQYRNINCDMVYEGEQVIQDRITGEIKIQGEPKSDKVIGYFAYFKLINGFEKAIYWSREKVLAHAKKYSPSFGYQNSAWQTEFDKMALKTVLKQLLDKYGPKSVEMIKAEIYEAETEPEKEKPEVVDIDKMRPALGKEKEKEETVEPRPQNEGIINIPAEPEF